MDVEMRKEAFGRERADSCSRSSRTKSALALFSRSPHWATSVGRRYGDGPLGGPGAQGPPDCSPEGGIPSPLPYGGPELHGGVRRRSTKARRRSRLGRSRRSHPFTSKSSATRESVLLEARSGSNPKVP